MLLGDRARRDRARRALAPPALRAQLERNGSASLRLRGGSMRPLLFPGALVELRPVRQGESLEGAIVAIDAGEAVVVHRVRRELGGAVHTQGIAQRRADPPWPRAAVIGVVCALHSSRGLASLRSETILRNLGTAAVAVRLAWLYRAARLARGV